MCINLAGVVLFVAGVLNPVTGELWYITPAPTLQC